ncbi:unnamed protein product [Acanthoscelides obtectus]|uniref:Secreted protein n=1 Tax=Acanthoscelides obtectus TaxID=200917 RepID=A0A9P0PAF9_ACAOB|nr:unnamed protein product [Acanthoscelides obtectus]CAK1639587.1 hypothetical protein AOBTE_LOCUS11255 [Acanthoscelides obtectus]
MKILMKATLLMPVEILLILSQMKTKVIQIHQMIPQIHSQAKQSVVLQLQTTPLMIIHSTQIKKIYRTL